MGLERGGLVGAAGLDSFLRTTRALLPADHFRQTRDRHVGPTRQVSLGVGYHEGFGAGLGNRV